MEQLPKIVVQRLQATEKAGVHPDPDLLTAFAEKSLGERERVLVLEHLANCAVCREVVSLSLPQLELQQAAVAAAAPVRFAWSKSPLLRWGAVAACLAIVGTVALMHRGLSEKQLAVASKEEPAPTVAEQSAPKLQTAEPERQTVAKMEPQSAPQPSAPRAKAEARADMAVSSGAVRQGLVAGLTQPSQMKPSQMKTSPVLQKKAMALPLFGKQVAAGMAAPPEVAANSPALLDSLSKDEKSKAADLARTVEPQASAAQPSAAKETVQVTVSAASPPAQQSESITVETAAPRAQGLPQNGNAVGALTVRKATAIGGYDARLRAAANLVTPRWTLSSDGGLLMRSLDAGKTWQTVPVAANVVLRAVAAFGAEIWVGGEAGALYHSSDAGQHWAQVKPTANGKVLHSDIFRIEFSDAQHGKLTTTHGEVWTTADAGHSWQQN